MRIGLRSAAVFCILIGGFCGCGSHEQGNLPTASISGSGPASEPKTDETPRRAADPLHPVVVLHMSLGDITVTLDRKNSPITVENFLQYAEQGLYDNTLVHQVLDKPAVIVAGGYDTFRKERPTGPPIRNEAHNGLKNSRLTIAMARRADAIDSSTSQFFINAADNPDLDHTGNDAKNYGYCVFGTVTDGAEVVERIARRPVHDASGLTKTPVDPVVLMWTHIVQ
jgi:cyclophilin family peptidyl-prolyl cis-trans isomerase